MSTLSPLPVWSDNEADIRRAVNTLRDAMQNALEVLNAAPEFLRAESDNCSAVLGAGEFPFLAFNDENEVTQCQLIADMGEKKFYVDAAGGFIFRKTVNNVTSQVVRISADGIELFGSASWIIASDNGTRFKVAVSNAGILSTTSP